MMSREEKARKREAERQRHELERRFKAEMIGQALCRGCGTEVAPGVPLCARCQGTYFDRA